MRTSLVAIKLLPTTVTQQIIDCNVWLLGATDHQPLREMEREEILQIKTNKKHSVYLDTFSTLPWGRLSF